VAHGERQMTDRSRTGGLELKAAIRPEHEALLTPDALGFVAELVRTFGPRVDGLLERRAEVQARLDAGWRPDFLPQTREIREGNWTVAKLPSDLWDRRVEITGPVDRKMIINALNSGASVFMADFEDSNAPSWANCIGGQKNLRDAVMRTIEYTAPGGKQYRLGEKLAVLMVRPRGWHLPERHVLWEGKAIPAALFDFGLYFFHNAHTLVKNGTGPYFYLPKLESHLEARVWNDVFVHAQRTLGLPKGTIKATVLIETILAAFEMDEILWELKDHSAGLNCGRWDYIFSFIKRFRNDAAFVLPDRSQVTMTQPFMRAYAQRVIQTCHRRNVHAMGGMAAQIPIKNDPAANEAALEKVRADKQREVTDGHDGTWVAHPGLVALAKEIFDSKMPGPNQIERKREDVNVTAEDLLSVPGGTRTEAGLRQNVNVGLLYLEAWLGGTGSVPLYNLMEDAATAEISRTQLWQWARHGATLEDGRKVTRELLVRTMDEETERIRKDLGQARFEGGHFDQARQIFERLCVSSTLEEFLTLPAYEALLRNEEA
jgi:malate synthase